MLHVRTINLKISLFFENLKYLIPGCGHCKNTKPEFLKAANHFRDDSRIELAAVDCTKHQAICKSYEVGGYPTIKYFNYLKNVKQYEGGRTVIIILYKHLFHKCF